MANNSLLINQGTNSAVNFDSSSGTFTQVIAPAYGTISTIGTIPNIPGGTVDKAVAFGWDGALNKAILTDSSGVVQVNGTVNVGTISTLIDNIDGGTINRIEGGTIGLVTRVSTLGTLEVGTIATLPNIPGGSIVVTTGTIAAHAITAATITEGTLRNLISGTINAATAVLNSGTINVATAVMPSGTLNVGTINNGTFVMPSGTVTVLPNLPQGSINVTAGTVTNLLKVEDAGHSSGDSGVMALAVRNDNGTALATTDLDYIPLQTDANGALRIGGSVVMTLGTVATHAISAATITEGTLRNLISGTINAATAVLNSGTINVGTFVMPSGTLTVLPNLPQGSINVTAGTITNLLKAEDAGHASGDSGVMSLAVRNDNGTALATTDLDYIPLQTDANGALRISGTVATGAGTQPVRIIDGTVTSVSEVANLAKGTITKLEGGTLGLVTTVSNLSAGSIAVTAGTITNLLKVEDAGHSTGDSGVMALAVRNDNGTALATTDLDYIPLQTDANGALRISGTITGPDVTVGTISVGTINTGTVDLLKAGTITKVEGGSIIVTAGTVVAGTLTNLISGTINAATAVLNSGTINVGTFVMPSGTVTVLPNLPQGSINVTAGTITNLLKAEDAGHSTGDSGVMALAVRNDNGTALATTDLDYIPLQTDANGALRVGGSVVVTLGTVAAHAITAATITEGTLRNLISGTINSATAVLNSGTINVGTFVMPSGTITTGSIIQTAGTLNTGTINTGTFSLNPNPTTEIMSYGTTTNGTIGTLIAAPSAGSAIFISYLDVQQQSGTAETVVSWGLAAQGNQVLSRGNYIVGGGIAKSYPIAVSGSATGTALTFNMLSGAGTVSYNVGYFIAVP
jgi:hypothetical protein